MYLGDVKMPRQGGTTAVSGDMNTAIGVKQCQFHKPLIQTGTCCVTSNFEIISLYQESPTKTIPSSNDIRQFICAPDPNCTDSYVTQLFYLNQQHSQYKLFTIFAINSNLYLLVHQSIQWTDYHTQGIRANCQRSQEHAK